MARQSVLAKQGCVLFVVTATEFMARKINTQHRFCDQDCWAAIKTCKFTTPSEKTQLSRQIGAAWRVFSERRLQVPDGRAWSSPRSLFQQWVHACCLTQKPPQDMKSLLHLAISILLIPLGFAQVDSHGPARPARGLPVPKNALPPEIQTLVDSLGRYPLHDLNRDGWDDLWTIVYGFSRDGRSFTANLQFNPAGDADGDGISNYVEMLDFRNPWGADAPVRQLTPKEIKAARVEAFKAARKNDAKIVSRFHAVLEERGVFKRGTTADEGKAEKPVPKADESAKETSFYFPEPGLDPNRLMLVNANGQPEVIFFEKLSNATCLLAWEGAADKLFDVEWSDDMVHWRIAASSLPTVNGVGTWGQTTVSPARFYRVMQTNETTTPSDPDGGDGITTFGGTIVMSQYGNFGHVHVKLPSGVQASTVNIFINGEFNSYATQIAVDTFAFSYDEPKLPGGDNTVYAQIDATFDTTICPENPGLPSPGVLRTPEVSFENDWEFITGFRVTESEINTGLPDSPLSTVILLQHPAIYQPTHEAPEDIDYEFRILHRHDRSVARVWTGTIPAATPGELRFEWNGTADDGSSLSAGIYDGEFSGPYGDAFRAQGVVTIRNGQMPYKALALYERLDAVANWAAPEYAAYQPPWESAVGSCSRWGPWQALGGGPAAICGTFQNWLAKHPDSKWRFSFWGSGNRNSDAQPWSAAKTFPANDFVNGNPFNSYDLGVLIGHGVASSGGTYMNAQNQQVTLPPQHYFPMIGNPTTGQTVWLKSGQMAKKFGEEGKLKWMFVMTCNYLRVAAHNIGGGHDIYAPMKQQNILPFGNGLRVLCGYTTYIHLDGALGNGLNEGLLQQPPGVTEVVDAWNHAWLKSKTNSATSPGGWGNNARSVYWPECEEDTILGVMNENVPPLQAHTSQADLEHTDSRQFE